MHVVCGKIASGKSTLAQDIARDEGGFLLSEDFLLAALYPKEIFTLEDYRRCTGRLREAIGPLVISLLDRGHSIVLDFQANTTSSREWIRHLFEAGDADHKLHYLEASDAVCRARLSARNAGGRYQYQVSEAEFDLFTSYFVPPTLAEGVNVIVHKQA